MDWRTYFRFGGRIRRRDFWVFYWLPAAALNVLVSLAGEETSLAVDVAFLVLALAMLWGVLAGTSKRLHDLNYSLWLWFGLFGGVVVGAVVMSFGPLCLGKSLAGSSAS